MNGAILVYTLEYTHTNKGLLLNCRRGNSQGEAVNLSRQHREKPHLFYRKNLLTKDDDDFLRVNLPPFPLIYINLPPA